MTEKRLPKRRCTNVCGEELRGKDSATEVREAGVSAEMTGREAGRETKVEAEAGVVVGVGMGMGTGTESSAGVGPVTEAEEEGNGNENNHEKTHATKEDRAKAKEEARRSQVVRKILTYELDLEILQKWREVQVIEEEIARGRLLKSLVEKLIMNEYVYGRGGGLSGEDGIARPLTAGGYPAGVRASPMGRADSVGPIVRRAAAKSLSYISSGSGAGGGGGRERAQTEPQAQYEVRPDGTIVRMRCPKCGAEQFRSMLGFLNHCRIHCRLTFSSQDERLQRCGVDPSEVPPDYFQKHPTQLKQEMDLALIRADVLGPVSDQQRRPTIHIEGASSETREGEDARNEQGPQKPFPPLRGSRFYVKRQIIIGNAAKCIADSEGAAQADDTEGPATDTAGNRPTHKWRLFIRSPRHVASPSEDLRSFIKGIRFFLHPNYRPKDVVDVVAPPFELIRAGWGEFPVRIQIHFWDPRNHPVEIVHLLRIVTATSHKFVTVAELAHDLDLDRRTDFEAGLQMADSKTPVLLPDILESPSGRGPQVADVDVLMMCIGDFPLAGKRGKRATSVRYRPLPSMEDFLRLDIAEQRKHERNRANALCTHLMSAFPTFAWTVEQVISWCRAKGFTPASVADFVAALEETRQDSVNKLLFCRFCGLAHLPQDKFDVLQKNCSLRPRKIHVSSKTMGQDLLGSYELLPDTSETVKKLRQDYFGPTFIPFYDDSPTAASVETASMAERLDEATLMDVWTSERIEELHFLNYPPSSKSLPPFAVRCVARAMKGFARHLIESSLAQIPDSKERTDDRPVLLTPLHIYRAITGSREFDFLSNAYMLGGGNGGAVKESPRLPND